MARITSQKATEAYGNKFELVLAASQRAREIKNGSTPRVESNNGPIITALKEIEEGKYTQKDFLSKLNRKGTPK
jgi:DNA-directed RNA polymerase subunit omega